MLEDTWQLFRLICKKFLLFRYLQGNKNMRLCFGLSDLEIARYTNANFAGNENDKVN